VFGSAQPWRVLKKRPEIGNPGPVWEARAPTSERNPQNKLHDNSERQSERESEKLTFSDFIDVRIGKEFDREQTTFHEPPRFFSTTILPAFVLCQPSTLKVSPAFRTSRGISFSPIAAPGVQMPAATSLASCRRQIAHSVIIFDVDP